MLLQKPASRLFAYALLSFSILVLTTIWLVTQLWLLKKLQFQTDAIKTADFIAGFGGFVAAIIAIITVLLAYRSLRHAQKAEEGALYLRMMERYASAPMKEALRILSKWHKDNSANIPGALDTWMNQRNTVGTEGHKVEEARHLVKYFFRDLMQLVQAGYFSHELAKRICNTGGRHLFKKVVLLMDEKINAYYFEGEFDPFPQIYAELDKEQKKMAT